MWATHPRLGENITVWSVSPEGWVFGFMALGVPVLFLISFVCRDLAFTIGQDVEVPQAFRKSFIAGGATFSAPNLSLYLNKSHITADPRVVTPAFLVFTSNHLKFLRLFLLPIIPSFSPSYLSPPNIGTEPPTFPISPPAKTHLPPIKPPVPPQIFLTYPLCSL